MAGLKEGKFPVFFYIKYFLDLKEIVGNTLWVLIALFFITSLLDSIGITMVIPLLESAEISDSNSNVWIKQLLEKVGVNSLREVLILVSCIFLAKGLFVFWKSFIQGLLIKRLVIKLKRDLRNQFERSDYSYFIQKDSGFYINLLNNQTDDCIRFVENFSQFSSFAFASILYVIVAFSISFKFSVVLVIYGAISQLLFRRLSNKARSFSSRLVELNTHINSQLIQLIHFFKFLRATSRTEFINEQVDKKVESLAEYRFKTSLVGGISQAISEPITLLFLMVIIFYQVSVLGLSILPILVILMFFYRSMNMWLLAQQYWINTMGAHGGLVVVRDALRESSDFVEPNGKILPVFKRHLLFDHVSFYYRSKRVLDDVTLLIPKNKTIAFVGASGAGKTTMVDLLHYLLKPQSGKVMLDNTDLRDLDIGQWRQQIGYVSQEVVVFNTSVLANICCSVSPSDEDKVKAFEAAKRANCHDFILELEHGFETVLGERGLKLSGGQKQRIGIARELFRKPELLILDEATSALDSVSEELIRSSISDLKGQMTIVVIAHRLSTIKEADIIYVLKNGKIIEEGSYLELMNHKDEFFKLVELQKH